MAGATSLVELILKKWGAPAAGVAAAGQSEESEAGFITKGGKTLLEAWHGSPHKFDKFSMDQIGTGEGNQMYGHGLYFADSEDVARGYRDSLTQISPTALDGFAVPDSSIPYLQEVFDGDDPIMSSAASELLAGDFSPSQIRDKVSEWAEIEGLDASEALSSYDSMLEKIPGEGSLYRTEIDVTPESLLDWDKPLGDDTPQQMKDSINALVKNNPDLKDALYQAYREDQPGSIYYSLLSDYAKAGDIVKNQQFATQQLNDAGIKGIKYLDGDSRAVGDGTSNYVIFDDSLINIAERGNADPRLLAGTAAGTAGLLAAGQSDDSEAGISAPLKLAKRLADLDPKIDAHISERPTGLILDKLVVPEEVRGQGIGGELMERLTSYADEEGQRVALTAAGDFGGSRAGQEKFYRRHGFVPNKGRNKDFEFTENMIRTPSEGGNADPRLLAGTAAGTAGLLGLAGSDDADAAVSLRLLKDAPEAYNSLRKQIARGRQKGLSPQRVAEKFIHDQSITNYDKGFNSYAMKVDGMESGDYWKEGVQNLYDEIMGAVDEPDPMVAEAMGGWLDSHLGREAGVSMAENRARALKKRKAAATAGGVAAGGAAGGASADEGLPVPTWGDVGESLFTVLDMPMTGLQGMARGIGGLLSGEDMATAAAEANHMMGGGSEEGWDRVGKKVTEKTGDETLGFYAKWLPSLLSPF